MMSPLCAQHLNRGWRRGGGEMTKNCEKMEKGEGKKGKVWELRVNWVNIFKGPYTVLPIAD